MKMKTLLLTAVATLGLTAATMAQNLPNYVPSNGLVGWWSFNGNANDESGNGNNGTVNGATLTSDRFGNANKAYNFDGINGYIQVNDNSTLQIDTTISVAVWSKFTSTCNNCSGWVLGKGINSTNSSFQIGEGLSGNQSGFDGYRFIGGSIGLLPWDGHTQSNNISGIQWNHVVFVFDSLLLKIYINGILDTTYNSIEVLSLNNFPLLFGAINDNPVSGFFNGDIDDAGIWNRALTQQEITDLYNASNCSSNTTINPQIISLSTGSAATFNATTSDPSPSYVWQSDFGQGFQTLNNYGNYSGVNTNSLSISNVQLSEHNQQIRVISKSGDCIDTSNVAVINILDTCIANVTVYDTLLTTVTDTLIINTTLSLPAPNNENTILIYPNPASDHITIYNGNFTAMIGYSIKITNNAGQEVFLKAINQAQFYVDLNTWSGNGLYFVHLIDPQNNTVTVKKIVLQ